MSKSNVNEIATIRYFLVAALAAAGMSAGGAAVFLFLEYQGYTTGIPGFGPVSSSVLGAIVLWRRYPAPLSWLMVVLYVPMMAVLLIVITVIVAAHLGLRFET